MDDSTFAALTEVLAIECKLDGEKYNTFVDIFYGEYKNKSINFIDLASLNNRTSQFPVLLHGNKMSAHVASHEWFADAYEPSYYSVDIRLRIC